MNRTLLLSALIAAGLHAALLGVRISPSPMPGLVTARVESDLPPPVEKAPWYVIVEERTDCFCTIRTSGCGPFVRMCPTPLTTAYAPRPITSYLPLKPIRPPTPNAELRECTLFDATNLTRVPPRPKRPPNRGRM